MLAQLANRGIQVERNNRAQQPLAFAKNLAVRELLQTEGTAALPVVFWDGEIHLKGRYPTNDERPAWIRAARGKEEVLS